MLNSLNNDLINDIMLPNINLIRRLLERTERVGKEIVYVAYENGSKIVFELGPTGGAFPVNMPLVEYVLHTHPVPRFTPSLADVVTAFRISRAKGRPVPLFTISRVGDKAVIYEIKVSPRADIESLINEIMPIEEAVTQDIEKFSRVQHYRMISRRDISVTRFILSL